MCSGYIPVYHKTRACSGIFQRSDCVDRGYIIAGLLYTHEITHLSTCVSFNAATGPNPGQNRTPAKKKDKIREQIPIFFWILHLEAPKLLPLPRYLSTKMKLPAALTFLIYNFV